MAAGTEADGHEHGEGENYFVSMTDMMVGMLFIFIILLMSFALQFRQQTEVTETATREQKGKVEVAEEVGRKLDELGQRVSRRLGEVQEATLLRRELLDKLQAELTREGLTVEVSPSGDVLRLRESEVRFDPDSEILQDKLQDKPTVRPPSFAKTNVGKIARVLARILPGYAACRKEAPSSQCRTETQAAIETVFVEGHTDETGSNERNWVLSAQRAVNTYLELTRVAPGLRQVLSRRNEEVLSISGYSSTRRIDTAGTSTSWARNRRIDLRFVMDTDPTIGLGEVAVLLQSMRSEIEQLKGPPQ